jgi:hypothetical protein
MPDTATTQPEVIAISEETSEINKKINELQTCIDIVKEDAVKGMSGNKQAARRARIALNNIKKVCTPLRIEIQGAIKKNK